MKPAHDVYAETNPAFCVFALREFIRAFVSVNEEGPEMPVVYLALPVALSGDLASTFNGTNKNTGLLEWLERSPQVQVELADRVNASLEIVTDAVRYGCFTGALALTEDGRLRLGKVSVKKSATNTLDDASIRSVKQSERLGYWFARAGSAPSVFDAMGLTV